MKLHIGNKREYKKRTRKRIITTISKDFKRSKNKRNK